MHKVSYFRFVCQKIAAFWSLLLIAGIVSLAVGFFVMLPDDYENLAESVVATKLFSKATPHNSRHASCLHHILS